MIVKINVSSSEDLSSPKYKNVIIDATTNDIHLQVITFAILFFTDYSKHSG